MQLVQSVETFRNTDVFVAAAQSGHMGVVEELTKAGSRKTIWMMRLIT